MNFTIPLEPAPGRPEFIGKVRERHEEILAHKPLRLLELHGAQLLPRWQRRRMIPRKPAFRQNAGRVIGAMLERADVASWRVGAPRSDGNVTGPGQQGPKGHEDESGIAKDSGCTITQVRRVIHAYERAGFLRGPRKGPDGKMVRGPSGRAYQHVVKYTDEITGEQRFHAHAVVYVFTPLFFQRLGKDIAKRRDRECAAAAERRANRAERLYPGPLLAGRELARGMKAGTREDRAPGAPSSPTRGVSPAAARWQAPAVDASENAARLAGAIAIGLRNKHPDWPDARIRAEALALARAGRLH